MLFLLSHRFIDVISNTRQWCTVSAVNRTGSLSTYFSTSRYKVLDRVDYNDKNKNIYEFAGFVSARHMIPQNPSSILNNQPVNLPSNEPSSMSQVNSNIPQPIYQPRMAPMTSTINSAVSVSPSMNSMHQQPLPGVGPHTQAMMPGHQQPQMPNMGPPQHSLPVGQPMIPSQHQQPMLGQMSSMPYGGPVHMGQYGAHQIPSQQVNPQPSAPNQVEQPKVEQPQVAELISFD